tara:strand:+ start:606 stop:1220 length:615 start_codon:yes stop_codon:yes gene_type:complete
MYSSKTLKQTPSQTVGPYFHIGCLPNVIGINSSVPEKLNDLVLLKKNKSSLINICGKIYDGAHEPIKDALVEIWQINSIENFNSRIGKNNIEDPCLSNWGRTCCHFKTGLWSFNTIKPSMIQLNYNEILAPHIWLWIAARGINIGLYTCIFFSDETKFNKKDYNLRKIQNHKNLNSLFARKINVNKYQFDIFLQGDKETIFFDI